MPKCGIARTFGSSGASQVALVVKEPGCQCKRCKTHKFDPWVRNIPWSRKRQPILVFLPGESHGQRGLASLSPYGGKDLDTTKVT